MVPYDCIFSAVVGSGPPSAYFWTDSVDELAVVLPLSEEAEMALAASRACPSSISAADD